MSKQYEEYKDSGITWLGEIPAHWSISPLKRLADLKNGYAFNSDDLDYDAEVPVIRIGDIKEPMDIDGAKKVGREIADQRQDFRVQYNDILIAMTGATIGKSSIYKSEVEAFLNQRVGAFRVMEGTSVGYLKYLIESPLFREYITVECYGGAQENISKDQLLNFKFPVPNSKAEAQSIADYLDYKTGQIDKLIAQKEELMKLLQKKRQAIINEAVTQGLNPNAPRRNSGIEWLGEIPEHWEVSKLKYLLDEPMMYGANEAAEDDDPTQPRYIRITDFGSNGKLRSETFKSLKYELAKDYFLKEGDILFARSGATVGKTFIFKDYEGEACFAGYLIKASIDRSKALPEFVDAYTKSAMYENWKNSIFIQATIQNISAEKYKSLIIPVPPVDEQMQIMQYLSEQYIVFDNALEAIEVQISKLKSYRQSIINEVVTGKVDVREVVLNEV